MRVRYLILITLLAFSAVAVDINPWHPRLLAYGDNQAECEANLLAISDEINNGIYNYSYSQALYYEGEGNWYRFGGDYILFMLKTLANESFRNLSIEDAKNWTQGNCLSYYDDCTNAFETMWILAMFDWYRDQWNTAETEQLIRFMDGVVRRNQYTTRSIMNNHFHEDNALPRVLPGLVLYGEGVNITTENYLWERSIYWMNDELKPAYKDHAGTYGMNPEGNSYWTVGYPYLTALAMAWTSTTTENLFQNWSMLNFSRSVLYHWNPQNGYMTHWSDNVHRIGVYNESDSSSDWDGGGYKTTFTVFLPIMRWQNSSEAAFVYKGLFDVPQGLAGITRSSSGADLFQKYIFYDAFGPRYDPDPTDLSQLERSAYLDGYNGAIIRSGWENDSVIFTYKQNKNINGHDHMDAGSFTITRGDYLAIASGYYSSNGDVCDNHTENYYPRTIAQNTITVYKPGQTTHVQWWSEARDIPNSDGGQEGMGSPGAYDGPNSYSDTIDPKYSRGDILHYEHDGTYTYIHGDVTDAYFSDSVENFTRSIFTPDAKHFIIYDHVKTTDPSYPKRWLLHSVQEPLMNGTAIDAKDSAGATAYSGNSFTIENVSSALHVTMLLPNNNGIDTLISRGGAGYEYWYGYNESGFNAEPTHDVPEAGQIPGSWRIEEKIVGETDSVFLNVLQASAITDIASNVTLINSSSAIGAMINNSIAVIFAQNITSLQFDLPDVAETYILGLRENTTYYTTSSSVTVTENGVLLLGQLSGAVQVTDTQNIPSHPRILYSDELIDRLKCRVGKNATLCASYPDETFESHKASYDAMKSYVDNDPTLDMDGFKKTGHILALGLLYYIEDNTSYADRMIDELYRVQYGNRYICFNSTKDSEIAWVLAITYDWLYDYMNETVKKDIEHSLQVISYMRSLQSGHASIHGAWNGHYVREESGSYAAAYAALVGENLTTIFIDGGSREGDKVDPINYSTSWMLAKNNDEWKNNLLPAWEQVAGTNGGDHMGWGTYYSSGVWIPGLRLMGYVWQEDLISNHTFYKNAVKHMIYGIAPNRDSVVSINDDGDSNWKMIPGQYISFLLMGHVFNDTYAQWLINQIDSTGTTDPVYSWVKPFYLMYYNPDLSETEPNTTVIDDTLYEDGTGVILARSGWTDEDFLLLFKCGDYFDGHSHFDNNQFQIYYKGELALRSGSYPGDTQCSFTQYSEYYKRTISTNSMLIEDPTETYFNPLCTSASYNYGIYPNDGGQSYPYGSVCTGTTHRPQCYGDVTEGSEWDRGDIIRYHSDPNYMYAAGNATASYNSSKMEQFIRSIIWFKDTKDFIVIDHISATEAKPDLVKKWLMHTMDMPTVVGTTINDSLNAYGGGIIEYSQPSSIKVTDQPKTVSVSGLSDLTHTGGDGILYLTPLSPTNQTVQLVGGPDSNGENYTGGSSTSSYEFYYGGEQHLNRSRSESFRDDTPAMGVWRMEIQPDGADIKKDNVFINHIHLTYTDSDIVDVSSSYQNNIYSIIFNKSSGYQSVVTPEDFTTATSILYSISVSDDVDHLVLGLQPNEEYIINQDGSVYLTLNSTTEGTLWFNSTGVHDYVISNENVSVHAADTNSDGCIQTSEMRSFVSLWKTNSQSLSIVVEAFELWKSRTGCP